MYQLIWDQLVFALRKGITQFRSSIGLANIAYLVTTLSCSHCGTQGESLPRCFFSVCLVYSSTASTITYLHLHLLSVSSHLMTSLIRLDNKLKISTISQFLVDQSFAFTHTILLDWSIGFHIECKINDSPGDYIIHIHINRSIERVLSMFSLMSQILDVVLDSCNIIG